MSDISDFINQLNSVITETTNTHIAEEPVKPKEDNVIVTKQETSNVSSNRKLKLLIVSTHANQSNGYSKVIHNIIKELSTLQWISVTHFGTQKIASGDIGRAYPSNVKVIDGTSMEKNKQLGFAFSELPGVINTEKPDIVFIYNDISIICSYIEEIRKVCQNRFFKIWAYLDITYKSPPQQMIDIIKSDVERIFCFTKSWKDELKNHGITRPVDVMNHGFDSKMVRQIPKELARQSLGLPKDVILFTSMNKNIPRKRLDILIMAFVKLIVKFPTKPLFMLIVADSGTRGGFSLFEIFAREIKLAGGSIEGLGNRLLITSKDTCYKDEDITILYNCGDVGVSCAEGEGFGLCSFEQMALGIPQIVPDINGYSEYCNEDNSIMIKPTVRYYVPQAYNTVTGEAYVVDPEDVSKAMEKYAFDENLRKIHGKLAKDKVSNYTWSNCCSAFIKRLKTAFEDNDD
jgi:glycosyltransferase involved in cell wall biosynthesis